MKYLEQRIQGLIRQARKLHGRKSRQGARWPKEFKQKAVVLMTKGGLTAETLSARVGITAATLRLWQKALEAKGSSEGFRRLSVVDGPRVSAKSKSPVKIFVTTAHGSEVHGLTADEVAALIRRGVL